MLENKALGCLKLVVAADKTYIQHKKPSAGTSATCALAVMMCAGLFGYFPDILYALADSSQHFRRSEEVGTRPEHVQKSPRKPS